MLAAQDQENMLHGYQQAAASKPLNQSTRSLQPKTPGTKFPKTPLKIPLNDENMLAGIGGKTGKEKGLENLVTGRKKGAVLDKHAFVTPLGPRTRAPLGMKTTNAKAKPSHTPVGPLLEKELEKTGPKQTSTRKVKNFIHADTIKLEIEGVESPLAEQDTEYCPPRPDDRPYASEDFPDKCLDYTHINPQNLMKGIYNRHHRKLNYDGISEQDRRYQEVYQRNLREADEAVAKMMDEEWTVGDVPETFRHLRKKQLAEQKSKPSRQPRKLALSNGPATIISKTAASILSVTPEPGFGQPVSKLATRSCISRKTAAPTRTASSNSSSMRHTAATAASKSTIGYTKGRVVPSILQKPERSGLVRSVSNLSQHSDKTITPANFASEQEWRSPSFLRAFEVDDEDLEPGLRGIMPNCLRRDVEDEEEFVLTLHTVE